MVIRGFIGGMRDYNKGIFVNTSSFSKDARHEAERANVAITLIDLDWLVELLVNNYKKLDVETKALVPLKTNILTYLILRIINSTIERSFVKNDKDTYFEYFIHINPVNTKPLKKKKRWSI